MVVADRVRLAVQSILTLVNDTEYRIHFVGHSLGGSLASLAAMDMSIQMPDIADRIRLYTYGQPRYAMPSRSKKLINTCKERETTRGQSG